MVGARREVVAVDGSPLETGDSMGLALVPIWLSWGLNLDAGKQQNYKLLVSY